MKTHQDATSGDAVSVNENTSCEQAWPELVERIKSDDNAAMEELYRIFSRGVRFSMWRRVGRQDLDDRVHETFLIVTQAIRNGELREPERLMGFVRTVVRRQIATYIAELIRNRKRRIDLNLATLLFDRGPDPEYAAILHEEEELAHHVLLSIAQRDREILIRFYLREQTQRQICQDMSLTDTQFRLLKSRAKARFGELGRRRLCMRVPSAEKEA